MNVSPDATCSYVDANVVINFAVVDRLDLLGDLLAEAFRCTDAVAREVARFAGRGPLAQRLETSGLLVAPVRVEGLAAVLAVEDLRFRLSGRSVPTKNLGEAQCIHLARSDGGVVVTDDRAAADFARSLGVTCVDTAELVSDCHRADLVTCPEPYELLLAMQSQGRGVRVPPSHHHVC